MEQDTLEQALGAIERDDGFARSPTLRRVLGYLVDSERKGESDALTPYRVAIEAFGKPDDFDPATSASVRVEMARLRRLLAEYRQRHPERPGIDIPRGSYRPQLLPPAKRTPAHDYAEFAVPPAGPGVMVLGFACNLAPGARHVAVGLARLVYEELTRYRWLYIVDALDLEPSQPGLFDQCVDRYECQFLLRGNVVPTTTADTVRVSIELLDAITRGLLWRSEYEIGPGSTDGNETDIAVAVAQVLAHPFGIVTIAGLNTQRSGRDQGRWAAADLAMRFNLYLALELTPHMHADLLRRTRAMLDSAPQFALGWKILGSLTRDEYVFRMRARAPRVQTLQRASECFERALMFDPLLSRAAFLLATVRYFLGDAAGFEQWLQRALSLHGNHPEQNHWGGVFLCLAGRHTEGSALLERAGMSHHHAPLYRAGTVLGWFALGRQDEALAAAQGFPDDSPIYVLHVARALLLAAAAQPVPAAQALARAVRLQPELQDDLQGEIDKWFLDPALAARVANLLLPLQAQAPG